MDTVAEGSIVTGAIVTIGTDGAVGLLGAGAAEAGFGALVVVTTGGTVTTTGGGVGVDGGTVVPVPVEGEVEPVDVPPVAGGVEPPVPVEGEVEPGDGVPASSVPSTVAVPPAASSVTFALDEDNPWTFSSDGVAFAVPVVVDPALIRSPPLARSVFPDLKSTVCARIAVVQAAYDPSHAPASSAVSVDPDPMSIVPAS